MNIENIKIEDAKKGFDNRDRSVVSFSVVGDGTGTAWIFNLENPTDVKRLNKLMQYAEVNQPEHLNGKEFRAVISDNFLHGFGHPIQDKYIPISSELFQEVTEAEFAELLKPN